MLVELRISVYAPCITAGLIEYLKGKYIYSVAFQCFVQSSLTEYCRHSLCNVKINHCKPQLVV